MLAGRQVAVDTETSGFSPDRGHELLEIAVVVIDDGQIGEQWSSLIRSERPIPPDATAVHGITDSMAAMAPPAAEVAAEFRTRCADATLVLHHAAFDLGFIGPWLARHAQPPLWNPVVETLGLSRIVPGDGGLSLSAIAGRLGIEQPRAHRALADALTTARLWTALAPRWEREQGFHSLIELAAASQDAYRQWRTRRGTSSALTAAVAAE